MSFQLDAQGHQTGALFDLADLEAKDVLEIGCGDGRTSHGDTSTEPPTSRRSTRSRSRSIEPTGAYRTPRLASSISAPSRSRTSQPRLRRRRWGGGWGSGITSCR